MCAHFPPEHRCGPIGPALVAGAFIVGLTLEYLPRKSSARVETPIRLAALPMYLPTHRSIDAPRLLERRLLNEARQPYSR